MSNRCADNVIFVQCILPHREYLFSKFSPKITHEGKKVRWLYIRDQLVASGMTHFVGKDDSYMRQKWADMKRRTMEKLSRIGQNSRAILSEVDTLILRIIGDKGIAELQTHHNETNEKIEKNLITNGDKHEETTLTTTASAQNGNADHLLSAANQQQILMQNSANFIATKCEPITTTIHNQQHQQQVSVVPLLQHREPSPQKIPSTPTPTIASSSVTQGSPTLFNTATVTDHAIIPSSTSTTKLLRRKRKFLFKRIGDNRVSTRHCNHCQHQMLNDQQQHPQQQMTTEKDDLDEHIKRAKLAYYKSQIDLNNSLKSESIMRKRLLTLQIEQIEQEIEEEEEEQSGNRDNGGQ